MKGTSRGAESANPHGALGALHTTFGAGAAIQGLAALAGFATLPLLVGGLGTAAFGVLVVIVSVGPWLTVIDGALYWSVRLVVGELRGAESGRAPQSVLEGGRRLALRIVALNVMLVGLCLVLLPIESLLGAAGVVGPRELILAICAFSLPVIASGPGGVAMGALEGVGRTVVAAVFTGLGPICALPLTLFVVSAGGGLIPLAFIQGLAIGIPRFSAFIYWRWRPSISSTESQLRARIRPRLVGQMAFLTALTLGQTGLAALIVASQLGPEAAASYGLVWRLVGGALVPLLVLTPFIAASLAAARGDGWGKPGDAALRTFLGQAAGIGLLGAVALILLGPAAARFLGGGEVLAPQSMFVAGGAFVVSTYLAAPLILAFTGPRALKTSVFFGSFLAVLTVTFSLALTRSLGPSGPLWAAALAALTSTAFWLAVWRRHPEMLAEVHNRPGP